MGTIDSETFYLAKDGKRKPKAELTATINAFFNPPSNYKEVDHHPICAYPARLFWLRKQLKIDQSKLPKVQCSKLKEWLSKNKYNKLSVIFSSYYPDNPASMFGHTFLRLHQPAKQNNSSAGLLDQSINFSAFPDTSNPLLYTVRGLAGSFPGKYQLMPYFMKVQEYNNAERRDLWQYELDFSVEEIEFLLLCLWEIGSHHVDYYYFDDNCSAVILTLLEAVKPHLNLKKSIKAWVIPSDTLRAIASSPGLIRSVSIEPSVLTKFLLRYQALDSHQKKLVSMIFHQKISINQLGEQASMRDTARQAKVIDTVLELIDFEDRVAGSSLGEKHAALRHQVLLVRSKLKEKPQEIPYFPETEQPHLGHPSSQLGLNLGLNGKHQQFAELNWRPALHELLALEKGYSENLEIGFFHTSIRYKPLNQSVFLNEYSLLRIWSLPTTPWIIKQPAWTVDMGSQAVRNCTYSQSVCQRYFVNAGAGYTTDYLNKSVVLYLMLAGELGHSKESNLGNYIAPALFYGLWVKPVQNLKVLIRSQLIKQYGLNQEIVDQRYRVGLNYSINDYSEVRLNLQKLQSHKDFSLGVNYYF